MTHTPLFVDIGRWGCWTECACGWRSGTHSSLTTAHAAHSQHLALVEVTP